MKKILLPFCLLISSAAFAESGLDEYECNTYQRNESDRVTVILDAGSLKTKVIAQGNNLLGYSILENSDQAREYYLPNPHEKMVFLISKVNGNATLTRNGGYRTGPQYLGCVKKEN